MWYNILQHEIISDTGNEAPKDTELPEERRNHFLKIGRPRIHPPKTTNIRNQIFIPD